MKYFGTYNNDSDLVPKSYVDNLLSPFSHIERPIEVSRRLAYSELNENYVWDDCYSEHSYDGTLYSPNVAISIDPNYRFTSLYFTYTDDDSIPTISQVKPGPANDTIYYVLQLSSDLQPGKDLFVNLRSDNTGDFDMNNASNPIKIRVLIPETFSFPRNNNLTPADYRIYYNGKYSSGVTAIARNGYFEIGC